MRIHETRTLLRGLATCVLITAATACGSASTTTSTREIVSVVVSASRSNVSVGNTLQLSAVALDANGLPVTLVTYYWSSSNTAIATVSSTGVVTGVALGSATISAFTGTIGGSKDITVGPVQTTEIIQRPIIRG
jgi:uncharacterized protein YjdB